MQVLQPPAHSIENKDCQNIALHVNATDMTSQAVFESTPSWLQRGGNLKHMAGRTRKGKALAIRVGEAPMTSLPRRNEKE